MQLWLTGFWELTGFHLNPGKIIAVVVL